MTKCTCGHEKEAHHRGVSTCINGGRCLCALYTPVDPAAEAEAAWEAWEREHHGEWWSSDQNLVHYVFIAGWNAKEARL